MSTKIESTIRQIGYPQASVYAMLSDLSNIDRVRDRLPEDKIKDLSFDTDSISISTQMGARCPSTFGFNCCRSRTPLAR